MKLTTLETLLSLDRQANIIRYSEMVKDLEGDCGIFGCFKGGCSELIAKLNPHKNVSIFDSFEGLPTPSKHDNFHKEKDFNEVSYEAVYGYFKTLYLNVEIFKGFSPSVFTKANPNRKYCYSHIDVDLYQSVLDGLDYFYPRMVEGGVIVLDDFGFSSTEGAKIATLEFAKTITPTYQGEVLYYPNGISQKQYLIIK